MAGYTKDFLVDAFVNRFEPLGLEAVEQMYQMASKFYDEVGKDKFRVYASLDADAIRKYKQIMAA